MNFTDIFVRRPVFATILSLIILLVGIISYNSLTYRLFPKISAPRVTISVSYPGADAQLVESFVTTPLESSLSGIDGIDYFVSTSSYSGCYITVFFKIGYDISTAVADINANIISSRSKLPSGILDPVVHKHDPNAHPTMWFNFSSDNITIEEITDYLNRGIKPQIQILPGIAKVSVWGEPYVMRIWFNPQAMAAYSVTASDIKKALLTQSLQAPSGQIETSSRIFNVKTFSELTTSEQFNHLVIKNKDGRMIRIDNIGHAEFSADKSDGSVTVNGKISVVMPITPNSSANPLEVSSEVKKIFPKIKQNLPQGLQASILGDASEHILESIKEIKRTIVEATLCVILVIFLFLGSWRSLLIPIVTIPLSLIGVCGIILPMGYSLNTITFLALVLAVGMVVDDAIVVTENIHRHMVLGKDNKHAALIGARELQVAVISMTLTLAAVYAPIGFLTGIVGSLFKEFAFTLAGAVIISGFIALTLSPMMCSKIMKNNHEGFSPKINLLSDRLKHVYKVILSKTLIRKKIVILIVLAILAISALIYKFIPKELIPSENSDEFYISIQAPTSATLSYTQEHTKLLEKILDKIPEKKDVIVINGYGNKNTGFIVVTLKPQKERKKHVKQIIAEITPEIGRISGINAFPFVPDPLPVGGGDTPVDLVLQTQGSYEELYTVMHQLETIARSNPNILNVRSNIKIDQSQLDVYIDRNKAGDLGVPISDVSETINFGIGKPIIGRFSVFGRSYDVVPQLEENFRNTPEILGNLYVSTISGSLVPLSQLITVKRSLQSQNLEHFQQLRSASLSADLASGYALGHALDYLQKAFKQITQEHKMQISYSGFSRQYFEAGHQMEAIFVFAIIFIFLVLAAQFESFLDPLIVLFSVPLSIFGALLLLFLTKNTINIYSQIGLVTLIGLIIKHGILMVEFANQLQLQGNSIHDAIIEAATVRLRPILMTTCAMVISAIPLVLASGEGAVSRQQIGWVIIGGMSIGTIFTLFVIPTMYLCLASHKKPAKLEIQ